uniref:Uncharacterized protein n=1 Tax=Glyptapanteles indiensis TaxID=92994 RepID=B7S935_GLYIN|nr:conserved hypothetical protein [Glyptapanteles indiensis]
MASKKFTVVKLSEVLEPGKNSYVIVPTSWVESKDDGSATVSYPSEDQLPREFERIINCKLALVEWKNYQCIVEREADTYEAGLLYVKRKDSSPMDEEVLMLWNRISLEIEEKLGRLHPAIIISQVWSRFWK